MTIKDEEGYELAKQYLVKKYGDDYVDFLETEGQSYLDGFMEGRKEFCLGEGPAFKLEAALRTAEKDLFIQRLKLLGGFEIKE